MKYLLSITVLVFHVTILCGQWTNVDVDDASVLSGIHFINDDEGFVCGENEFYHTDNAGLSWESRSSFNDSVWIEDVQLLSNNRLIAIGQNVFNSHSFVISSADMGFTWIASELPYSSNLNDVHFVSDSIGYIAADNGLILKTIDGGISWDEILNVGSIFLKSIYFINENIGLAVGGRPGSSIILKTRDGGESWIEIFSPSQNFLQGVSFVNDKLVYAVGWEGEILMSTNCGNSWVLQSSVLMSGNLDVQFINTKVGVIVGGDGADAIAQRTVDGGVTWEDISPTSNPLIKLFFSSDQVGYAVGAQGTVLKLDASDFISSLDNPVTEVEMSVYPNPVSETLILNSSAQISKLELYSMNGQIVKYQTSQLYEERIRVDDLESGVYLLKIYTGTNVTNKWVNKI